MPASDVPLRLVHLANHDSNNVGNGALILGLERVLREDLGSIHFTPEPWDAYTLAGTKHFGADFVDLVNEHDALLVGGAVMLNGMRAHRHTGTRLDVPLAEWRRLRRPVVFYSVAYNVHSRHHYYHREQLRRFMEERVLMSNDVLFAVRNDGTKRWIEEQLGYGSERIIEVPDPALYVPTVDAPHPELEAGKLNLLLALNSEGEVYRFGGRWPTRVWRHLPGWKRRKAKFLRGLAHALDRLAREYDLNVVLCPHCPSDFRMMSELIARCTTRVSGYSVVSSAALRARSAPWFYDLYRKVDIAVGMRVHSVTCAVGLGVPVVAVADPGRVHYFLKDAGLADLAVDVTGDGFGEAFHAKVAHVIERRKPVQERVQAVFPRMRARTVEFNARVAAFLEAARG